MHLLHLFTPTLLLSAGALALALPTSTSTFNTTTLSKRGNYGWITTYAPTDPHCMGGYDSRSRPKLKGDDCMIWSPSSEHIGVNFGTYPWTFDYVDLFSDLRCKNKVGRINHDKGRKLGFTNHANKGVNVCQSAQMGSVLSIRAMGVGDEDPSS